MDFAFVDGLHTYEGVKQDIQVSSWKDVKSESDSMIMTDSVLLDPVACHV